MTLHWFEALQRQHVLRYAVNGLIATAVHFSVLQFNMNVLSMSSAGLANFLAAFFGIAVSFIGSRYFVFQAQRRPIMLQAIKFSGLYALTAFLHGLALYAWSDLRGFDYRVGFLFATVLQVLFSYWGNKLLVFNK